MTGESEVLIRRYTQDGDRLRFSAGLSVNGVRRAPCFFGQGEQPQARIFEAGSITKTMTAALALRQAAAGRLSFDSRLDECFLLPAGDYATLRQLATHTAGYGTLVSADGDGAHFLGEDIPVDPAQNPLCGISEQQLLRTLAAYHPQGGPFAGEYSNFGISVLGLAAARAAGQTYSALLEDFWRENGLSGLWLDRPDAGFTVPGISGGRDCGNWLWHGSAFLPCGGVYATLDGLLAYGECLARGVPDWLAPAFTPLCESFEAGCLQGLCWIFEPREEVWWHNGGTGCFKTFLGVSFKKRAVAVCLSNQKARGGTTPEQIGFALLREA